MTHSEFYIANEKNNMKKKGTPPKSDWGYSPQPPVLFFSFPIDLFSKNLCRYIWLTYIIIIITKIDSFSIRRCTIFFNEVHRIVVNCDRLDNRFIKRKQKKNKMQNKSRNSNNFSLCSLFIFIVIVYFF